MYFAVTRPMQAFDTTAQCAYQRSMAAAGQWRKIWITNADVTNKMMLLAAPPPRSTGRTEHRQPSRCSSPISNQSEQSNTASSRGGTARQLNLLFIDDLLVPKRPDRRQGRWFPDHPPSPRPERILLAAEAIDSDDMAIPARRPLRHANAVGVRSPIGMNRHPAPAHECSAQVEAANLIVMKSRDLFDKARTMASGEYGEYLAAEQARGVPHGHADARRHRLCAGCHVERDLREVLVPRTAPVSPHMILNFLAEKVAGASQFLLMPAQCRRVIQSRYRDGRGDRAEAFSARSWLFAPGDGERRWRRRPPARRTSSSSISRMRLRGGRSPGRAPSSPIS